MKKFSLPCNFNGQVAPFVVYIGEPKPGIHPLQNQSTWLSKERGGTIMPEIMDSLLKLYDISLRNKISFEELCLYAVKLGDGSENANNIKVNSNEKVIDVQAEVNKDNSKIINEPIGQNEKIQQDLFSKEPKSEMKNERSDIQDVGVDVKKKKKKKNKNVSFDEKK